MVGREEQVQAGGLVVKSNADCAVTPPPPSPVAHLGMPAVRPSLSSYTVNLMNG